MTRNEVGKDFWFDAALGFAVKVLDDEDALADLVKQPHFQRDELRIRIL